jgi:hypothetical protein
MYYLHYIASFEAIIPDIIGVFNFQQLRDKLSKPFLLYLILLSILEFISLYLSLHSISNHFFYNLLDLLTIIFFTYIFRIEENKIIVSLLALALVGSFLNFFFRDSFTFKELNYYLIYLLVGIISLLYIAVSVTSKNSISFDSFRFWLFSGFLITSLTTINLYFFYQELCC